MKTLKEKMLNANFLIIIFMPICIFLVFNITTYTYSYNESKRELQTVADNVDKIVNMYDLRAEFKGEAGENPQNLINFDIIRTSMQISEYYSNTEFFLFSDGSTILSPIPDENSFVDDTLIEKTIQSLLNKSPNEITTFRIGTQYYHAIYKEMVGTNDMMFYVSSGHFTDEFAKTVNIALLGICLISILSALVLSNKIAKSISTPIVDLSEKVKQFESGDFITIDDSHDCSEICDLKSSINSMSKKLKDYDAAQKSFLLNASHELRTPLMSIGGYAEGIGNGIFEDPREMAGIILEESKRLNLIVEELLTLSRIENHIYSENAEILNLSDIIKDYVLKIKGYAINQNINLDLHISNDELMVFVDDNALAQAVINIVSNCIRYAKTSVDIKVYKEGNFAKISIHDDGDGINDKDIPYIFDRFFKGKGGNLGLGLSISKTAIEYMKGTISCRNDNGAVFEISLNLC